MAKRSRHQFDLLLAGTLGVLAVVSSGCHRDMQDQSRFEALEATTFFDDGRSSRPRVPGTVLFQEDPTTTEFATGRRGKVLVDELPVTVDRDLLERGHERFNIYCSICHGRTGEGNGTIVQRGYKQPPTYHSERLRGAPVGHLYEVITYGYATMPPYAPQVQVEDRWAIIAYIRALQLSQYATLNDVPEASRRQLEQVGEP